METRSRKRAEESTSSPTSGPTPRATKRSRSSSTSATKASTTNSISTRSRTSVPISTSMDPTPEPSTVTASASTNRRRGKAPSNNKNSDNNNNTHNKRNKSKGKADLDKGKEKESEIKQRNTGRSLGLNINDNDNDGEGGVGNLSSSLASSSALQGLLRRIGANLDDFLPSAALGSSRQNETLKKILLELRADGEEGKQVEALTQLSDMLSIGTEDSLGGFSLDSFVPVLVGLLGCESNPDIMLLAARALTHLVEALPSSCATLVRYGAVACFVARLLTIEYMDLAEQSLQALKKISQEQPTPCLRAGALMAVLSYLDFFPTGVQRVALSTAENMCKKLPTDAADFVMEAVPSLTNLLQYHDAKVIEHASICLTRIAEAFASSPEKLDELCSHGIVTQTAALISSSGTGGGQASLGTSTYTGLIRLLSTCASGSSLGAKSLLLLGISGTLKDLLLGPGVVASMSVSPALGRPPEQIFEIVNLANELLPPFPQGTISLPASSSLFVGGSLPGKGHVGSSGHQEDSNEDIQKVSTRAKLLNEQPGLLQQFGMDLLPVLVQIYGSSVNGPVRHKCLSVIGKIMYFSTSEMIQSLMNVTNISSFLAGVLALKDPQVLVPALQIAEILMEKLPSTFSRMFVREGVVHAMDALVLTEDSSTSQLSSSNKANDSIPGSSSRSKRNKRRGASSSSDTNLVDECNTPAPSIISPAQSVETPTVSSSSLRVTVSARAKVFKEKYFPSDADVSGTEVTDDLQRLRNLCATLNMGIDEQKKKSKGKPKPSGSRLGNIFSPSKEEQLVEVIAEVLRELSREDGASTFEFMGSGVVSSLLNYFTCGFFSDERISEANLHGIRLQATKRYKSFVSLALPLNVEGNVVPMSVLVQKLQNALSSLERFPLLLSHTSGSLGGIALVSSGLSTISQPIKLRLCRAREEKILRDYSSNVVLVDPLASLAAIEDFLMPRVQRNETGQEPAGTGISLPTTSTPASGSQHRSMRSRSSGNTGETTRKSPSQEKKLSSSKGKGKSVVKPTQEDAKGPQTRSAARRRSALDNDSQVNPVDGDTSSEEDELDALPVDIDEGLVIEDDYNSDDDYSDDDDDMDDVLRNSLPICTPESVHDIKLGDSSEDCPVPAPNDGQNKQTGSSSSRGTSGRGSDSNQLTGGSPFRSGGALSFAAAAMAGLASPTNRGLSGRNDPPKLIFTAGGRQLNGQMTVYQAIQRQFVLDESDDDRFAGSDLVSSDINTIMYQRADMQSERSSNSAKSSASNNHGADSSSKHASLLDSIMQGALPCDLERNNPTYNILALLRILEGLNQLAPRLRVEAATDSFSEGKVSSLDELNTTGAKVSPEDFVNRKLTPKLAQQIQDTLALCTGSLPSWCYQLTKACPFLFPFETRTQYFYSTAFGFSRALYRQQQQQGANGNGSMSEREVRIGRLRRQKVRVSRNRILDSAAKVMEMYSSKKTVLEVEYFGEVGTGLGPTLEFYTLLSHELQEAGLGMWRLSSPGTVHMPLGLFPRPWSPNTDTSDGSQFSKVIDYFRMLGRVMAKALQDGRLLDLPISSAFYKLVLGQELDLYDIISFDAELGTTLQELAALVKRKEYLEAVRRYNPEELRFRGASIDDLCFDFSLPGYPEYILKPGNEYVDASNLGDYVAHVVDATIGIGIMRQIDAFRSGFNQVFDISTLRIFTPSELDYLLCGLKELWKAESLADHIKFDHGYTSKSPAIINFLEIVGGFTPELQRAFCQFVTGAPKLPPGGLAVLNPKLTIVRKLSSSTSNSAQNGSEYADDDLPSVMTCANYLKLPPYSTKEIMYKKLVYAISEGQGSFDLS
ncbi:E3 ubiquitin-protein ligase upl3 [Castilleja foliolosa]|uniref:HECT-type E3 ubiquitin transferase n=1 Tax=Castilleja foliolosa TaxID=1961234 RepID=A0ABD3BA56_9LAMI